MKLVFSDILCYCVYTFLQKHLYYFSCILGGSYFVKLTTVFVGDYSIICLLINLFFGLYNVRKW